MKNVIVIGFGLHFRYGLNQIIKEYTLSKELNIVSIIDFEDLRDCVKGWLENMSIDADFFGIERTESQINGSQLDEKLKSYLQELLNNNLLDKMIISTEPKAHIMYAKWALKNNVDVLMDKPISAPIRVSTSTMAAKRIYDDFLSLKSVRTNAKLYILTQRREHPGYKFVTDILRSNIIKYEIPVTSVTIYHGDGVFNIPSDFDKENHPYKYGYGKLLHSGYHFIDLLAMVLEQNRNLYNSFDYEIKSDVIRPYDYLKFCGIKEANLIAGKEYCDSDVLKEAYHTYGELDVHAIISQITDGQVTDGQVVSLSTLALLQSTISNRAWFTTPVNTYKENGRLRHEGIKINISHLLSVHIVSYQSQASHKIETDSLYNSTQIGGREHFEIAVYRNTNLIGGKPFELIDFASKIRNANKDNSFYMSQNEQGKRNIFKKFLNGEESQSELIHHETTNLILSKLYESISYEYEKSKGYESVGIG